MERATAIFLGPKVKYHLISITKSISKIFKPNFVCVLTNKRCQTYQTGFSFCRLCHAPGVGLKGVWVSKGPKHFFSNIAMWQQNRMQVQFSPYSQTGVLGVSSNIIKFWLQSQFQRFFIPNFVCVLTNIPYKTYPTGF